MGTNNRAAWLAAILIPLAWLILFTPYGMDTTDFGYFYAYGWRILQGQMPWRDFYYIKPALPLYWHALWMSITPENLQILAGKAGFLLTMLASAWFCALYLAKFFNLPKLGLPLPLLATSGFIFSVHSFPHTPWHTADGVFFCALALWLGAGGAPFLSGIGAACAALCKQSFMLVPAGILVLLLLAAKQKRQCLFYLAGLCAMLAAAFAWIYFNGSWPAFRAMTTGQLDINEALDAGIYIYLRQNWLIPLAALAPAAISALLKKNLPAALSPCYCYLAVLVIWYVYAVYSQKTWIGFGASWPTLFMLIGAACVFLPGVFLARWSQRGNPAASAALAVALLCAWSAAISGGYKIPAFFATPLLFSFYLLHARLGGNVRKLAWAALLGGMVMFGAGYQYPYVFPQRPLARAEIVHDAGKVFPKASGVLVDADMLTRLEELKALRAKYGPLYKTLPGFTFAYYLNGDMPVIGSDWLIDWEINGDVDKLYNELIQKGVTVFMERDQMNAAKADAYARAGYGVSTRVRANWKIVEETPHFVVFQAPRDAAP